ncbi:MFS transporter [Kitasatospora sp. MAP5-34]|uniref:MFS transporter n=1 Tax=Kitasatospora sp. MAP5-34 TaxID=3035102 RepID=UPI002475A51E|nr:MFS transporter [Kitasatospora sp. MAP5-34]MDH6576670.1 putative MFS family arabinose efflux permease [Kitasatospora sp. MAP5-34]
MFASYRRIFAAPGAIAFTLAGLLGRLSFSMVGVSTVVMIATRRDSYALAGAVTATGVITGALGMPLLGRLVDRYGQSRVAVPSVLVAAVPFAALPLCARYDAPAWTLFVCFAASSVLPNLGGMARARWAYLYRDDPEARRLANSFEQALDELCFMAGPVLAMLLCTSLFPEAGLTVAVLLSCTGGLAFAAQRRTEPPVQPPAPGGGGALRSSGLRVLVPAFVATGAVFGSMEVTTIAYADSLGQRPLAGGLLALMAAGSCLSGLAFGLVRPKRTPAGRLVAGMAAMAGLLLLPLAAGVSGAGLGALAVAILIAGSGTAPTMVAGLTLIQELLPAGKLNEGMAVVISGLLVGISAGSALGGAVAQHATPGTGYWLPAGAAALALLITLAGFRLLRAPRATGPA